MHSAHYDIHGNIILDDGEPQHVQDAEEMILPIVDVQKHSSEKSPHSPWTTIHETPQRHSRAAGNPIRNLPKTTAVPEKIQTEAPKQTTMKRLGEHAKNVIARGSAEGTSQLRVTADETRRELQSIRQTFRSIPKRMHGAMKRFLHSANTPIRMPTLLKKGNKPPTKLRLFMVDTIRFGGTFAGIFVVLFIGINAQSFFQIAKAELALGSNLKEQQALEQIVNGNSGSHTQDSDLLRNSHQTDLLSLLPYVGPYENRLIIPRLGENVPIVKPSMEALMQEDWKKFEDDIQIALRDGVVHYPGSAKPGQAGNFFLTGHSSYYPWDEGSYKDVFARLNELSLGDTYSVYYGGDKHTYRVSGKKEVKPSDVSVLDQPTDKRTATLMTCTPIGTTLRRLIVTADEIDPVTGETLSVGEKVKEDQKTPTARLESLPI